LELPKPSCFDVNITDRIAHIRLNRPEKRNSMIPAFWDELPQILEAIDDDASARVIVISSTGPHFSSGLDTSAFGSSIPDGDPAKRSDKAKRLHGARLYDTIKLMQRSFNCLDDCRMPVLAAIQGGAIGGAVDLLTACDLRYMSRDAFFSIFEINIGMTADVGTFPRLCSLLPEALVKELAYTGRRLTSDEAFRYGLVNGIFDDQQAMLEGVMETAATIASKAPLAIAGSKRIINYARDHSVADSLDYIALWNASHLQHDEIKDAMQANKNGRPADFVDLPPRRRQMQEN
jgi:enoyl-CoA hydratase